MSFVAPNRGNLINKSFALLDHGLIRLIDFMGSDRSIVRSARVSFDADWRIGLDEGSDARLIGYLMRNRHSTPFESVVLTLEVKAPIFNFRQWHRHRTQSYNEVSARYAELPEEFYVPSIGSIGFQSTSNKQARDLTVITEEQRVQREEQIQMFRVHCESAFRTYKALLRAGWPRELARAVLPLGTYSRMFTTMNLWNCYHFLRLRLHSHAQYEIRVYAEALLKFVKDIAPIATQAFEDLRAADERNPKIIAMLKEMKSIADKHRVGSDLGAMLEAGSPDAIRITDLENQLEALLETL